MNYTDTLETMLHDCHDPVEHERAELIMRSLSDLADLIRATDDVPGTLSMAMFALRDMVRDRR